MSNQSLSLHTMVKGDFVGADITKFIWSYWEFPAYAVKYDVKGVTLVTVVRSGRTT